MEWSFFWIFFLLVGGFGLILMGLFGVKVSSGRFLLAVFLILLGIKLLVQVNPSHRFEYTRYDRYYSDTIRQSDFSDDEVDVIFRSSVLTLTPETYHALHGELNLNTIFGRTQLIIPDTLPVDIITDAVFSYCQFPDGEILHFGDRHFRYQGENKEVNPLKVRADVIFGRLEIKVVSD